jgi:putative ABC transport system ATP-binding protein
MQAQPVVHLQAVDKTYPLDAVGVAALRHVDLEIRRGVFTVISGPSGSGKTTLLNLIGCIDRPDHGRLAVCGQAIAELDDDALSDFRARHLGFVFQNFNLLPVLTAAENVEMPLQLVGMPAAQRRARVDSLLDAVGLAAQARQRPSQLSGGQRQRVAIARALAASPQLVLADEPTANLDSRTGAAIIALMRRLQREQQVSFVISSHDPQMLAEADDAVMIRDGAIVEVRRREDTPKPADAAAPHPVRPVPAPIHAHPVSPVAAANIGKEAA